METQLTDSCARSASWAWVIPLASRKCWTTSPSFLVAIHSPCTSEFRLGVEVRHLYSCRPTHSWLSRRGAVSWTLGGIVQQAARGQAHPPQTAVAAREPGW